MSKKNTIKKTTSNITLEVEKRIIELHQKDKLGAQAISDKLSEEFDINFSRAPIGKRLTKLKSLAFGFLLFLWLQSIHVCSFQ